ncbi:hypothetical protein [Peredibacter starrii]|uniref:Uncharacterized protein n=1 Tax=Peredibacter starrii TaxID=28202 RepID=A0AAX4HUY7_9BACT|nr:hypothetical protein [Peredibacter starrii]WPU66903.1 hypothetical protein SOO65_09085 [Peredibacter starrii]
MKTMLLILSFIISQSIYARGIVPIKKGDLNLSQAKGEIISVKEICPRIPGRATCMAIGSVVEIEIALQGCLDRLGGYFTHFEVVDGKGKIFLSAVNISNEVSRRVMCVKAPSEQITLQVPFEGEIELVNTKFSGSSLIQL